MYSIVKAMVRMVKVKKYRSFMKMIGKRFGPIYKINLLSIDFYVYKLINKLCYVYKICSNR